MSAGSARRALRRSSSALGFMLCVAWPFAASAAEPLGLGAVARPVPLDGPWLVRTPAEAKVQFRGLASFEDAAIGPHGMVYPAPNLIGFLAAIAVHGAISGSVQDKKQAAIREAADKVLVSYQPVLDTLSHTTLMPAALAKTARGGPKRHVAEGEHAHQWVIESVPVFSMTQDQRALVLDNAFVVRAPEKDAPVVYRNVVRVVTRPLPAGDEKSPVSEAWLAEDGRRLREQSIELLGESIDLMFGELARGPGAPEEREQKTVRYPEGGAIRMERASPLAERCDRVVLKTLRGWVMSVPRLQAIGTDCNEPESVPKSAVAAASSP
ncbi:MAG TPA: hypothetical protein VGD46_14255 [Rhizobacter sp.]